MNNCFHSSALKPESYCRYLRPSVCPFARPAVCPPVCITLEIFFKSFWNFCIPNVTLNVRALKFDTFHEVSRYKWRFYRISVFAFLTILLKNTLPIMRACSDRVCFHINFVPMFLNLDRDITKMNKIFLVEWGLGWDTPQIGVSGGGMWGWGKNSPQ